MHEDRLTEADACKRCAAMPPEGQLSFEACEKPAPRVGMNPDSFAIVERGSIGWPPMQTSACGRYGFWRERTPAVFGSRIGVGPLVVALDTAILISLREELSAVEEGAGLVFGPLWSDRHEAVDSLRDLVQLWWWRDVRFWVSGIHLADARRPLSRERGRAREAAVRELERDFLERGGFDVLLVQGVEVVDKPCALHSAAWAREGAPGRETSGRQPRGLRDRQLVAAAQSAGCHVFLTSDKGILKCRDAYSRKGLAILSPAGLMARLEDAGELGDTPGSMEAPSPDLSAIGRLYGAFAPA